MFTDDLETPFYTAKLTSAIEAHLFAHVRTHRVELSTLVQSAIEGRDRTEILERIRISRHHEQTCLAEHDIPQA